MTSLRLLIAIVVLAATTVSGQEQRLPSPAGHSAVQIGNGGANQSTRLVTEVPLVIDGTTVEPGEYTLFVALSNESWTFIVSNWPAMERYDYERKDALFGAYDYTPDRDVLRTSMQLDTLPHAFDQLSWQFLDMNENGGRLTLLWDNKMASVPFAFAR